MKPKNQFRKIMNGPIGLVLLLFLAFSILAGLYWLGLIPEGLVYRAGVLLPFALMASQKMSAREFKAFMQKHEQRAEKKRHATRGHVVAGWFDKGGKRFYCRSKLEAAYAFYLDWQKRAGLIKDFEHEPQRFEFPLKRGNNSYLPDFRIEMKSGNFKYIEVKGWLDKASKTKLKRMKKYFPDVLVEVVLSYESPGIYKFLPASWPNVEPDNPENNA